MLLLRRPHFETIGVGEGPEAHGCPVFEEKQVSLSEKGQWEAGRAASSICLSSLTFSNVVPVRTRFQFYTLKGS